MNLLDNYPVQVYTDLKGGRDCAEELLRKEPLLACEGLKCPVELQQNTQ
jgi:hypothetical protein